MLGLREEAARSASVLGHNFPGNPWYQDSYAMLAPNAAPGTTIRAAGTTQDRPNIFRRTWNSVF